MQEHKIFISSVQKEFKAERRAIKDYVNGDPLCRRYFDVFLFEEIPARDRNPDAVYLEEVKKCDVYLCLLGNEYGSEGRSGISPTEREFREATKEGKTRLLFIKDGPDKDRHPKTAQLIWRAGRGMVRRRFSNIAELIAQVYAALVQYLEDSGILQTVPFDAAVCQGARFNDIDEAAVRRFLETARVERKFPLSQNTPPRKLFAHLNLLNRGKLSHAAALLFCRSPQKFRSLISAEIKCLHFHGLEVRKPIPSYQVYKGPLFDQVDEAVDFVLSKLNRAVAPGKTGVASEVAYEIPKPVVREAVVNAVAHRDYTSNAGIQVMLFSDRLEVWNPGSLPPGMTPETLRVEHSSVPRNPLISEPLFWAHYIERAGTGTLDMIALCRKAGLPELEFEQRGAQFVLTIRRKKAVHSGGHVEAQEAQVEAQEAQVELAEWQIDILSACSSGEKTGKDLLHVAGYRSRTGNFKKGLQQLVHQRLIALTIPDKPQSRLQKYRLTKEGEAYLKKHNRL